LSLYAANEGYLDDVDVKKVVAFEAALHSHFLAHSAALRDKINASGDYDKEIEAGLKKAVEDFKKTQAW
jgi:F-type H+-transporting ATPase subunit alpha